MRADCGDFGKIRGAVERYTLNASRTRRLKCVRAIDLRRRKNLKERVRYSRRAAISLQTPVGSNNKHSAAPALVSPYEPFLDAAIGGSDDQTNAMPNSAAKRRWDLALFCSTDLSSPRSNRSSSSRRAELHATLHPLCGAFLACSRDERQPCSYREHRFCRLNLPKWWRPAYSGSCARWPIAIARTF